MSPTENHYSILEYNDKLKQQTNIQNKFRIFSTFHRFPTAMGISKVIKKNISLKCIYEDISYIATCTEKDICIDRYLNVSIFYGDNILCHYVPKVLIPTL